MTELERLFLFAAQHHITKRQIGIVCYGKNWRNIYTAKADTAIFSHHECPGTGMEVGKMAQRMMAQPSLVLF